MANNYYFLAIALPPLTFGKAPEITFDAFERLLFDNLSKSDYHKTIVVRRYYDILNIRALLQGKPLDYHGNKEETDLEEAVLDLVNLPSYVIAFLTKYEKKQDRILHFPELIAAYFREEISHADGLLKRYLNFERDLRLVLVGFRAKQLGKDVAVELQNEDPEEEIVAQILAQKDAKSYAPPEGFEILKPLFEHYYSTPLEFYKALVEYRFNMIDELIGLETFSFDLILGYMLKLIEVEKWIELDKEKGLKVIEKILKESS